MLNSRDKMLANSTRDDQYALYAVIDDLDSLIDRVCVVETNDIVAFLEYLFVQMVLSSLLRINPDDLRKEGLSQLEQVLVRNLD